MTKQKTIAHDVTIRGKGIHTGSEVTVVFKPSAENSGFRFKRVDLEGAPEIEAIADYASDTSRGTTIEYKGVRVRTVEHVLAALVGLDLDNVTIEIDNEETPIMDGSSWYFVQALKEAGIIDQDAYRQVYDLDFPLHFHDQEKDVEMTLVPFDGFRITTMIDYGTNVLSTQNAVLNDLASFSEEFSRCRTFVFVSELELLLKNNLVRGGDVKNAIVFVDRILSQEELDYLATVFNQPRVTVLQEGILNNLELYYPNEPARHKLLDVVGDLALVGFRFNGHIIAHRPGHKTNVEFAQIIRKAIIGKRSESPVSNIDLTQKPLFDINQIMDMLPHRPPFLLVDKIMEMSDHHIVGVKNVTMNEGFFVGHFPQSPVMPGVLQIEAMAQTGGIMILSTVPDPENYITLFMKIDGVKFRSQVIPGDTILFYLTLASPIRRGICHMIGKAYVGSKLVMEAEMMAQIVKKQPS